MGLVVHLDPPQRPRRGEQVGPCRTSMAMYLMLADIEGMEADGGAPRRGLHSRTYRALAARGLVARFRASVGEIRVCLSPPGRYVVRRWRQIL